MGHEVHERVRRAPEGGGVAAQEAAARARGGGAQTTATDKRLREGNEIPSAAPLAIHKQSETTKHADRPRIDLELNGKRHRASSRGGMHGMLGHANGMSGMRQRPAER